ncbi:MAG TPA: sigma-70 family RNA polymerase sigma factor [Planctomycetota bacterium]|nr:sigma-70 family RNA polymerase sigma factor [Planctomycetota bacterium]
MAGNPEELALIHRCIAGESDGWRDLMKKYGALVAHAVRNTFLRVLKQADASLVDDAIQAVWLSLCADGCHRLKGFESKAALSTWLTVLSTRRALDYIRSEMRKGSMRHVHLDDEDRDLVKELAMPEAEEQYSLDEVFGLYEAMDKLAAADRLILKMYYLDGLSYRSIAGVMNVAPNTVSSYILRARDKLKKCIKEGSGGVS